MPCKATLSPVEIARDDTPREIWDWLVRKRKEFRDDSELHPQSYNYWGRETIESYNYETRMAAWEDEQEETRIRIQVEVERRLSSQQDTLGNPTAAAATTAS
ncbi:hypothetical protein TWF694_002700 [Orbilia ellipsospora]|uniref:Uncharacterized protein n=1 Tax=Orbilia ellipsospora TaxID=2528407 RepID=A0AAV9X8V1_9PEZI